jgi:hypothetical protein
MGQQPMTLFFFFFLSFSFLACGPAHIFFVSSFLHFFSFCFIFIACPWSSLLPLLRQFFSLISDLVFLQVEIDGRSGGVVGDAGSDWCWQRNAVLGTVNSDGSMPGLVQRTMGYGRWWRRRGFCRHGLLVKLTTT